MNPETRDEARKIFQELRRSSIQLKKADIVVCPPFIFLHGAREWMGKGKLLLGGQDIFWETNGAYTGEISGPMLRNAGVKFCIVGHSERRAIGETDDMINKKTKSALKAGIVPVICVGEKERDNHGYYLAAIKKQVEHAFAGISGSALKNCIVAYEPVWAVGNKNMAIPEPRDVVEMSIFIKRTLADSHGPKRVKDLRVIYGGSANERNAAGFLKENEIAGLLVGRESLNVKKFLNMTTLA